MSRIGTHKNVSIIIFDWNVTNPDAEREIKNEINNESDPTYS